MLPKLLFDDLLSPTDCQGIVGIDVNGLNRMEAGKDVSQKARKMLEGITWTKCSNAPMDIPTLASHEQRNLEIEGSGRYRRLRVGISAPGSVTLAGR